MNKKRSIFFIIVLSLFVFGAKAHDPFKFGDKFIPKPRSKSETSWIFTAGWNAVDDNSNAFKKLFAIKKVWSLPFYPSQGSAEIIGQEGVTYGLMFTFNRYKPGKEINGGINPSKALFFAWDLFAKYHFNEHAKMSKRYDPYFLLGTGFTLRFVAPNNTAFTGNTGFGMNYWFDSKWGMNIQSLAQFGLKKKFPRSGANYLHHSLGVTYIIDRTYRKNRSFVKPRYKWIHNVNKVGERKRY